MGLVPKANAFLNLSTHVNCSVVKKAFKPLKGAFEGAFQPAHNPLLPLLCSHAATFGGEPEHVVEGGRVRIELDGRCLPDVLGWRRSLGEAL